MTSITMNEIVLLMTGVLAKNQPSTSIVPKKPAIQLDKGVKNSIQGESYQLISSAKITPPEFTQLNENDSTIKANYQPENYKSLITKTQKVLEKDLYSVDEFNNFQAVRVKFSQEPRLISQRFRNEILIARRSTTRRNLPTLRFGNSGVAVRALQRLLVAKGYAVRVDGNFGALTETAVKAFQIQRNLSVDGVVGFNTWYSLTR
ncbi:peptidoglycan-binding protein [Trichormus variabilis ARAD]|nr:peptidoglycan-binding protein [Trichormus variabilis]MBC1213401.1 peptidoglycan-binding protein [Trichormus variabilis ARAD]MBC1258765.1 peptidoglycan-binding protein [Trichormus variabilis V5]MBC1269725.1 peptidoglycan-binding protein [Trichormus variabilis FSR]MBC1302393.1 peptidoglycan-binding protein [Trichormus variabilis N2B]MBC1311796.1 peptidoglycan-binding protein [Trichormus variabilis PNB]MBC1326135.1 peptidoglycan-binding protein [Trichormus variabilis 9RC]MBD2381449.1 peptido